MEFACEVRNPIYSSRVFALAFIIPFDSQPDILSSFGVIKQLPCILNAANCLLQDDSLSYEVLISWIRVDDGIRVVLNLRQ